jgi:hypothetical protein
MLVVGDLVQNAQQPNAQAVEHVVVKRALI